MEDLPDEELPEEQRKRLVAKLEKHGDWDKKTKKARRMAIRKAVLDANIDSELHMHAVQAADDIISSSVKDFDLDHVKSITLDNSGVEWTDWGYKMPFTGRNSFFDEVDKKLDNISPVKPRKAAVTEEKPEIDTAVPVDSSVVDVNNAETDQDTQGPVNVKESFSIVYSSVGGTGKTVSMLQLKERLPKYLELKTGNGKVDVVVAYLGFNTNLQLTDKEELIIKIEGSVGARKVLARRLVASAIISHNNPTAITQLPWSKDVYESYEIPDVEYSKKMLQDYMKEKNITMLSIVAGVDEVQLLNNAYPEIDKIGLGRYFLRILRFWQVQWKKENQTKIYLLPVGTGIELDWNEDTTTGDNHRIIGHDSTLITKLDFKDLTTKLIQEMDELKFNKSFGNNTERQTIIENVSAMYWPRVRLLQWLVEGKLTELETTFRNNRNRGQWGTWLSKWMLDEVVDIDQRPELAPGKGRTGHRIQALFEWCGHGELKVIPDGFAVPSMLNNVSDDSPMESVYERLKGRFDTMMPESLIPNDEYDFEALGFDVVTTAIHMGVHAIRSEKKTNENAKRLVNTANEVQKRRLGLALWFVQHIPKLVENQNWFRNPIVVDQGSTSGTTAYFPFNSMGQDDFHEDVIGHFKYAVEKMEPLFIRCRENTCCDYMIFYVSRVDEEGHAKLLCNILDAKHTRKETPDPTKIASADQTGLYIAARKVNVAVQKMGHSIQAVRLLLVTNRTSFVDTDVDEYRKAKAEVDNAWPNNNGLELLNKDTFDFGPFSDILMARRPVPKRNSSQEEHSSRKSASHAPSSNIVRKKPRHEQD